MQIGKEFLDPRLHGDARGLNVINYQSFPAEAGIQRKAKFKLFKKMEKIKQLRLQFLQSILHLEMKKQMRIYMPQLIKLLIN